MKNIFLLLLTLMIFGASIAFALPTPEETAEDEILDSGRDKLVDLHPSRTVNRLQNLEQRMDQLERDMRFQSDEIRNLGRSVNDLKRRS